MDLGFNPKTLQSLGFRIVIGHLDLEYGMCDGEENMDLSRARSGRGGGGGNRGLFQRGRVWFVQEDRHMASVDFIRDSAGDASLLVKRIRFS